MAELLPTNGLRYESRFISVTSESPYTYRIAGNLVLVSVCQDYSGMTFSLVIDKDSKVVLKDDNIYGLSHSLSSGNLVISASSGSHGLTFKALTLL